MFCYSHSLVTAFWCKYNDLKSNMALVENKYDSVAFFLFLAFISVAVFDQLDLVTYEEVVKLPAFKRKTLVLLGNFLI